MNRFGLRSKRNVLCLLALFVSTPTFASSGWYLLVPLSTEDKAIDLKAPLSQWSQKHAYDSASQCEAGKKSNINFASNFYFLSHEDYLKEQDGKKDPEALRLLKSTDERSYAYIATMKAAQCIKSDDIRLKK